MNIIIVDDDAFVSASLKIILESYSDITVLATGANGHDAISLYDTYIPDVLLMDIRMAGICLSAIGILILAGYLIIRRKKSSDK